MVSATVKLYKGIGLDPNYLRSMDFRSKGEQSNWFSLHRSTVLTNVNYNKLDNTFAVKSDYGSVLEYTYVSIHDMDSSGRVYYGFVEKVENVDTTTVRFTIRMDPIQTFMCEWSLGTCAIKRAHVDRFDTLGRPSRVTPPRDSYDGYGVARTQESIEWQKLAVSTASGTIYQPYLTAIIAFTADYDIGTRTSYKSRTALKYAVIPVFPGSTTGQYGDFRLGFKIGSYSIECATPSLASFISGAWMDMLGLNPDAVIGAWISPFFPIKLTGVENDDHQYRCNYGETDDGYYSSTASFLTESTKAIVYNDAGAIDFHAMDADITTGSGVYLRTLTDDELMQCMTTPVRVHAHTSSSIKKPTSTTSYSSTDYSGEPALWMSPITQYHLVDGSGNSIGEIPSISTVNSSGFEIYASTMVKSTGVTQILTVVPYSGESTLSSPTRYGATGQSLVYVAPAIDVLSDAWRSYCLTQRDSDRKMMWSNAINSAVQGIGNAALGAAKEGPIGVAAGAASAATGVASAFIQQDAKEQTIRNQPSTPLSQGDGFAALCNNFSIVTVTPDDTEMMRLKDYMHKYGYALDVIDKPDIRSRYYFNFIATTFANIEGDISSDLKQQIAQVMNNGITFFHYPRCWSPEYPNYENPEA